MPKTEISLPPNLVHMDETPVIEPLTRESYRRLPATERQIAKAITLDPAALVRQAQQRDKSAPEFLSEECLVYFIRQADRNGDTRIRDDLFRELLERCTPYLRGWFRGFGEQQRQDLQSEVMAKVADDLLAEDDRGDFMQVRFWKYLKNKKIDACRKAVHYNEHVESLGTGYFGNGVSERRFKLETEVAPVLSPEKFAMISEGLAKLPPRLRRAFVLRHYLGMKIGADKLTEDGAKELSIAATFGVSGRTIRNWLKEADSLLASFRGEA